MIAVKRHILWPAFMLIIMIGLTPVYNHAQPAATEPSLPFILLPNNAVNVPDHGVRSGLLYDVETNEIVWQKDIHYAYPVASLTKMMVALLVMEDINQGLVDWNDTLELQSTIIKKVKRKRIKQEVKERYTLEALLHLAMIVSHNEACNVIARHLSGSVEAFVERMNKKAAELGMVNTFFSNPHGLPARRPEFDNHSTALDMLRLSLQLIRHPELLAITRIGYGEIAGARTRNIYRNHNRLVIDFENEVDGLKTGYTRNARYCLAATAVKKDRRLIAIAIGAPSREIRASFIATLFDSYCEKLNIGKLGYSDEEFLAYQQRQEKKPDPLSDASLQETSASTFKTVWIREKKIHIIRQGETLTSLAQRYQCRVSDLRKWNRLSSTRLIKGQKLIVYVLTKKQIQVDDEQLQPGDSEEENPDSSLAGQRAKSPDNPDDKTRIYIVQPGDTLWKIARKFNGMTVEELRQLNNLQPDQILFPGMKLKVINRS
jgi:D-alanyl-D-alanine carboxypeptidase